MAAMTSFEWILGSIPVLLASVFWMLDCPIFSLAMLLPLLVLFVYQQARNKPRTSSQPNFTGTYLCMVPLESLRASMEQFTSTILDKADLCPDVRVTRGKPLENDFHITAHLGIDAPDAKLQEWCLQNLGPFRVRIEGLGFFTNPPKYFQDEKGTKEEHTLHSWDVLYAKIALHDPVRPSYWSWCCWPFSQHQPTTVMPLMRLHQHLVKHYGRAWHHTSFSPHVTIAYLKYGRAQEYVSKNSFGPFEILVQDLVFRKYQDRTTPPQVVPLVKSV